MSAFDLLSTPIKKYVRDKRWDELRPIQSAAIERIIKTDHNYILISKTASGKTEAAFLPILSKVDFSEPGVQVLYISPLIALINDQFKRVEELCSYLEVPVTKWHGEANRTAKERLIKNPEGIVLITPESLEAMFVNKPYNIKYLFESLKYVVVDEVHSFVGTDRGKQLQSLLARLSEITAYPFQFIGLSATMSEANGFAEIKRYTGNSENTKILIDRTKKTIEAEFHYFEASSAELPVALLKHLYLETKDNKTLIFPNSRGRTEEVAVKLKKLSQVVKGHENYFSHHSSVDREVREYVEFFAKNNRYSPFAIACTSTLELGIDIGSIDQVVQIDATHSIASLIQRIGRSGRRNDAASKLHLYATSPWSLLQSVACWLLHESGFIEPPGAQDQSYDLLLHQALSIAKGRAGIDRQSLLDAITHNFAFEDIRLTEVNDILDHMIAEDLLEALGTELIVGVTGERFVNSREFYSVFLSEDNLKVVHAGNIIGEVPEGPQIVENENILLAARIWKIVHVDLKAKKIEVSPAHDGKKPSFSGGTGDTHQTVREMMKEILFNATEYPFLNENSIQALYELRQQFAFYRPHAHKFTGILHKSDTGMLFYTFCGSAVNRTIKLLFEMAGIEPRPYLVDEGSYLRFTQNCETVETTLSSCLEKLTNIESYIFSRIAEDHLKIDSISKWGVFLPIKYQAKLYMKKLLDIQGTQMYLGNLKLIKNYDNS